MLPDGARSGHALTTRTHRGGGRCIAIRRNRAATDSRSWQAEWRRPGACRDIVPTRASCVANLLYIPGALILANGASGRCTVSHRTRGNADRRTRWTSRATDKCAARAGLQTAVVGALRQCRAPSAPVCCTIMKTVRTDTLG